MLDLYDKRYTSYNIRGAHKDNMAVRKQLVDVMFKRFDADSDGQVEAAELSQVRLFERGNEEVKRHPTAPTGRIYQLWWSKGGKSIYILYLRPSMDIWLVKKVLLLRKSIDLTLLPNENL